MFGAIAGGIASALAGGAMSKLFGGGQKAASGGIQGDVLATDNNTVGMGDYLRIKKSLLKCNWTIRKRLPRCKMRLKKRLLAFSRRLHARIRKTRYMHKMRCLLINRRSLLLA